MSASQQQRIRERERDEARADVERLKDCHGVLPNTNCGCATCSAYAYDAMEKRAEKAEADAAAMRQELEALANEEEPSDFKGASFALLDRRERARKVLSASAGAALLEELERLRADRKADLATMESMATAQRVAALETALDWYVTRDREEFALLDKGIGTSTIDGIARLGARALLTQPQGSEVKP